MGLRLRCTQIMGIKRNVICGYFHFIIFWAKSSVPINPSTKARNFSIGPVDYYFVPILTMLDLNETRPNF